MTDPCDQHLYLMQNCHGLLKIGRSIDVERRRKALEIEEKCRIEVVAIKEGWGDFEEITHIDLDAFRIEGEWFRGDEVARDLIIAVLDLPDDTTFPFALNEAAANEWLDSVTAWRDERALQRHFRRQIDMMKSSGKPLGDADRYIFQTIWLDARGNNWTYRYNSRKKCYFIDRKDGSPLEPLPRYTSEVEAALSLWRDEERPTVWTGSAYECCIAAFEAELVHLRRRYNEGRRGL